jgi:Fe-S-cluster containining protein
MLVQSFNSDLSCRILELYFEIDRQTSEFQSATGLYCPPGCGQCCDSTTPEATVIELLPAAQELFSRGEAQQWLEHLASIRETEKCILYQPDPLILGNGRCQLYLWRPSVCRLFGFGAMKNRDGELELVTCGRQKKEKPFAIKAVQEAISGRISAPSFDYSSLQIATLEPSLGRQRLPINQALQLALERYGLTIQLLEANSRGARSQLNGGYN